MKRNAVPTVAGERKEAIPSRWTGQASGSNAREAALSPAQEAQVGSDTGAIQALNQGEQLRLCSGRRQLVDEKADGHRSNGRFGGQAV